MSIDRTPPKFSKTQKVQWGLASLGGAMISGIYASLLPIFYIDYLGLVENASIIYYVQIIYLIVNALNDPLFGFFSDKSKLKKGRRIPFIRYTAPFLALTFVLVWFAPDMSAGNWGVFWWMVITTCLYDTSYTIIFLVYSALLPELTEDEQERNSLNIFWQFFSMIGTIFGFIIPDLFRNQSRFLLLMSMVLVGILGMALILYTSYKITERPEFSKIGEPLGFGQAFKVTIKNKSFLVVAAANFMGILIQSLIVGSLFYLADYVLQQSSMILLLFLFIPLLVGMWATPKLIKKWGVVRSDQFLLLIGGSGLILLFIVTGFAINELVYLALAIAAIGFVGPLIFTNVLFAQISDEDELKTGLRREAAFFGMNAFFTKPAQSLAIIIPAALLDLANFIPHALGEDPVLPQPPAAIFAIRLFIGLIPGIALFLAALVLQLYPIKGEYWEKIQKDVLILHGEKYKKLEELERSSKIDQS
jgi:GPH family glycoside/pentoside/hexuronide:cation symporter